MRLAVGSSIALQHVPIAFKKYRYSRIDRREGHSMSMRISSDHHLNCAGGDLAASLIESPRLPVNIYEMPRKPRGYRPKHCRFYAQGRCRNGDSCTYIHDPSLQQQLAQGRLRGNLKCGRECKPSSSRS
ncbi:hypothetical protein PENSPDRAFT_655715 [Peniophora sp. CONT]|nr:hypothetical protein PENSPDRAFT_655715 [Peniophora sp. CONT]